MGRIESVRPARLRKAEWQVMAGNGEGLIHGYICIASGNQALALHSLRSFESLKKSFPSPYFAHFTYLESRVARPHFLSFEFFVALTKLRIIFGAWFQPKIKRRGFCATSDTKSKGAYSFFPVKRRSLNFG
jgi:hypothetical protein